MQKQKGILWILILFLLDQGTKFLAVINLKGKSEFPLIKGILSLRYLENTGMAFGMLQGQILFLILICLIFLAAMVYFFIKLPAELYYRPLLYTAAIVFAGAVGNLTDRIFRGYVVDFISFSWIDFPTFNVADIYVTCGIFALVLLIFLRYKNEDDFDFLKPRKH